MKLYEYAAFIEPEYDDNGRPVNGDKPHVIVDPTTALAKDEATATMLAARAIPADHADHLDRVTVVVRPF